VGSNSPKDKQQSEQIMRSSDKTWSGRLPFRTDPETHRKIALAAQQANQSINAWMEERISQAANDSLGYISSDTKIESGKIRYLIEDQDAAVDLVENLAPFIKEDDPYAILRFSAALKKLLIGLDALLPFVQEEGKKILLEQVPSAAKELDIVYQLVASAVPLLKGNDPNYTLQLSEALKKFMIGLDAVKPFLAGAETVTSLNLVRKIIDMFML
jgi:HicB family